MTTITFREAAALLSGKPDDRDPEWVACSVFLDDFRAELVRRKWRTGFVKNAEETVTVSFYRTVDGFRAVHED